MERAILTEILAQAPGVTQKKNRFEVSPEHHLSVYIGQPGQAMILGDVIACTAHEAFVALTTKDSGATLFVGYDAIHAVADRPPEKKRERRAGF